MMMKQTKTAMTKTRAALKADLKKIDAEMDAIRAQAQKAMNDLAAQRKKLADAYDAIDLKIAAAATKATRKIITVNDRWNPVGCDLLFDGRVISAQDEMGDYCSQWVLRENGKIIGKFDYLTQGYAALRAGRI